MDADGSVVGTAGLTRNLGATPHGLAPGSGFGPVLAYLRDYYHATVTKPATGETRAPVRAGVRAEVPGDLPPHAAEIPAQAPDADGEPGPGLFAGVDGGCRARMRVFGPESLHPRVPAATSDVPLASYREYYTRATGDAAPSTNPAAIEQAPVPAGRLSSDCLMGRSSRAATTGVPRPALAGFPAKMQRGHIT